MNGTNGSHWWGRRWHLLLQELGLNPAASNGANVGRGVRVKQVELFAGRIEATVHLRDQQDCAVTIHVVPLDDAQWETVLDALGSQAVYSAQLLAGDMPPDVEKIFAKAGATLFPAVGADLQNSCGCGEPPGKLCPSLQAVYLAVGELLNDDPWLLFRLRGRDRQQILRSLRTRRNRLNDAAAEPVAETRPSLVYRSAAPVLAEAEAPALDTLLDRYWGRSRDPVELQHNVAPPQIDTALLRRLGPAPFDDPLDVQIALADVYRQVTRSGLALAFAPEPEPDAEPVEPDTLD